MIKAFCNSSSFLFAFFRESNKQIVHYHFPAIADYIVKNAVYAIGNEIKHPKWE